MKPENLHADFAISSRLQHRVSRGALVGALASLAITGTAFAQTAPSAAGPAGLGADAAGDIVVTARQRSERLQDVPLSISAVTDATLSNRGIDTLESMSGAVPGLQFGENSVRLQTFTSMRGVGDYSRNPGFDNRVGVYVDGIYLGRSNATDYPLFDVAQIEVLRGPQGTLFGKDTLTGAINITSVKPDDKFSARVTGQAASRNFFQGTGVVNTPITSNLFMRVSAMGRTSDGYILNKFDGTRLGGGKAYGGRAQLRYEPDPTLTIDLTGDYVQDRVDQILAEPTAVRASTGVRQPAYLDAPAIREVQFNTAPIRRRTIYGVSLNIEKRLGDYVLTSLSSYRYASSRFTGNDADLSSVDQATLTLYDKSHSYSQEVRLASPGNKRFNYVVGGYFLKDQPSNDWLLLVGSQFAAPPLRGQSVHPQGDVGSRTLAAFGHGTFRIVDGLALDAGERVSNVRKTIDYRQIVTSPLVTAILRFQSIPNYQDKLSETWADWTASLRYNFTRDISVYGTYSRGRRPGGWNADFVQYTNLRFGSEKVKSYEVGFKSLLFDRALRLNIAAYKLDFTNFQITQNVIPPGAATVAPTVTNAGAAYSKGIEVEAQLRVGRHFDVNFGGSYNRAKFTQFINGDGSNYAGNYLIQAPKWVASVSPQVHFPIASDALRLTVSGDLRYQSKTYSDPSNSPDFKQDGRTLVGARAALAQRNDRWEVAVFARNLFDVTFVQDATVSSLRTAGVVYNEPRTVGVEGTVRF